MASVEPWFWLPFVNPGLGGKQPKLDESLEGKAMSEDELWIEFNDAIQWWLGPERPAPRDPGPPLPLAPSHFQFGKISSTTAGRRRRTRA